jgi:nucleotide-binding universal stress UspA family protein
MKKMLVALDGSPREKDVLRAAIALGRKTSAKLVLLRSVGVPRELPKEAYAIAPEDIPRLLEQRAQAELDARRAEVPPELRGPARIVVGTPWQSIDRVAREEDVDLIVIGSTACSAPPPRRWSTTPIAPCSSSAQRSAWIPEGRLSAARTVQPPRREAPRPPSEATSASSCRIRAAGTGWFGC